MKVSVILPIYGVENYIERCARSLFEQTLLEVEYIFVNDATLDKSIEILQSVLKEYPNRSGQVKVLIHEKNKGLPAARNTGLAVACGEYIYHCDSDDYLEVDMLEQLYEDAVKKKADIVWCDWFLTFEKSERYMKQPEYVASLDALKAMLSGVMKFNVWNKLTKRSLYVDNKIIFPDGYGMGEDMTMMMLFVHAKKVSYIPKAFYHYVKFNAHSFCQTYSDKHLSELKYNVERIVNYIRQKCDVDLEKELAFFKLEVKFPFLLSDDSVKYELWRSWYPEVNHYICQNTRISKRNCCLQWLAWKKQFWLVRIYYYLVYRLIYGIIYR